MYIQCSEISLFYLYRNTENITFELVRELSNIGSILLSIERYIATGKGGMCLLGIELLAQLQAEIVMGGDIFTKPGFKRNLS